VSSQRPNFQPIARKLPASVNPQALCTPIDAAWFESPITAIICRKPSATQASMSFISSALPTPRRWTWDAT